MMSHGLFVLQKNTNNEEQYCKQVRFSYFHATLKSGKMTQNNPIKVT